MPVKNIIPGQRVTKEKLQRVKELRREMTPAEKILWIAGFIVALHLLDKLPN